MRKLLTLLLLLSPYTLRAQVAVAPLTLPRAQFLSSTGVPLAAGCVNFFATGTSTPQAIYTDSTGTSQLANPLTLDTAGEASVWMTNTGYDIVANTGVVGQPCSSQLGTQLWRENNKNPFSIINQGSNFIVASATSDPSGVPGELGYRSDIPCLRVFTSLWDCVVELTLTQTLTNKTLVSPLLTSGGSWTGSPALTTPVLNGVNAQTGVSYTVASSDEQKLVTLSNANPVAVTLPQTTTAGFGAGTVFHLRNLGAGIVTITPTVSQIDGVATLTLLTGQGADIYSDGTNYESQKGSAPLSGGAALGCTNFTPVTVTNTNASTPLQTCTISANALSQGSLLEIDFLGIESEGAGYTLTLATGIGGGTACSTTVTIGGGNNQPWNAYVKFFVLTSGASGTANMSCGYASSAAGGGVIGPVGVVGAPTISVNTTVSNAIQTTLTMSVANAGNTVIGQLLKAVIF